MYRLLKLYLVLWLRNKRAISVQQVMAKRPLPPRGPGTWMSTKLQVLLCTEGRESETRQPARFLMDLVFQWLLSYSLKQGFG